MLLTRVILDNYGVYRNPTEFDFSCTSNKPIILCGGTNGAGKTTLFESILLCLYGVASFDKKPTQKEYDQYLARKIHRYLGTPVSAEHASITVQFQFSHQGKIFDYKVTRMWENDDGKINEIFTIQKRNPGQTKFYSLDSVEESQWQSFINELIPRGIAKLFFFDGEKIVQMANEGNEDIEIKSSFDTLLGLDLVEQLKSDISISILRNLKGDSKKIQSDLDQLLCEKDDSNEKISRLQSKQLEKQNECDEKSKEITELESKITKIGGGYAQKRDDFKEKKSKVTFELSVIETEIQNLCSDLLPFCLIPKQLEQLKEQLSLDNKALEQSFENNILRNASKEVKSALSKSDFWSDVSVDSKSKKLLSKKLLDLISAEKKQSETKLIHNLSLDDMAYLSGLIEKTQNFPKAHLEKLTKQFNLCTEKLARIDLALTDAPSDDEIGPLLSKLNEKNKEFGMITSEIEHIQNQIMQEKSLISMCNVKIRNITSEKHKTKHQSIASDLAQKTQDVLDEYAQKLRAKKLSQLEEYLLEGLHILLHKENFIHKVSISPDTFEVTLYRDDTHILRKDDLSKGEQQMFATAVLWALQKTSGRPLPFIIDTPLARLDVAHRKKLVEKFFPMASHQVMIFSTDSEIDQNFYSILHPYVTRSYSMRYDPKKGKTRVDESYFWDKGEAIEV